MSFINYMAREINCKLVYYGPGLCGKTTNLQYIYERTNPDAKGKMISLATETERTLFFDFLPLSLGEIRGFKTRFHLYTVPGQVFCGLFYGDGGVVNLAAQRLHLALGAVNRGLDVGRHFPHGKDIGLETFFYCADGDFRFFAEGGKVPVHGKKAGLDRVDIVADIIK